MQDACTYAQTHGRTQACKHVLTLTLTLSRSHARALTRSCARTQACMHKQVTGQRGKSEVNKAAEIRLYVRHVATKLVNMGVLKNIPDLKCLPDEYWKFRNMQVTDARTDRWTNRCIHGRTGGQTNRCMEGWTGSWTHAQTGRWTDAQTDAHMHGCTDGRTNECTQTNICMHERTDRHTDTQTHRHTDDAKTDV